MVIHHKTLESGKWQELTLKEQMGNIGSEVSRAIRWKNKDEKLYGAAIERALELLDFTLRDPRWLGTRRKEIARVRELICDAVFGKKEYHTTLENLDRYFFQFALAARAHR